MAGEYNLEQDEGSEQFIRVERIIVHPGWTGDLGIGYSDSNYKSPFQLNLNVVFFKMLYSFSFRNDIAILKLVEPVYDNGYIEFARLPYAHQMLPHGFTCYITGWGLMDCENKYTIDTHTQASPK